MKSYYIKNSRINYSISNTVIPHNHISFEGMTYERVSKAPSNRIVQRRLINPDTQEKIIIYG